jgi:hypothetical protein
MAASTITAASGGGGAASGRSTRVSPSSIAAPFSIAVICPF